MALTTAQQVRLRIQDNWRYAQEPRFGDGSASAFRLSQGAPYSTISGVALLVSTTAGWTATGGGWNTGLGLVTFSGVISANSAWQAEYQWAVFSDDEVGYFTAVGGTINGAAREAVKTLMFDNARRARWSSPDGTSYDDTKSMSDLRAMYDLLVTDDEETGPAGGIESWGEQQMNYSGPYAA